MRWQELFSDLDAEWEAAERAGRHAETVERVRAERARVALLDRLRGSVGARVSVTTAAGEVTGELCRVLVDALLLADGQTDVLVPVPAVQSVGGLGERTVPADQLGAVERRMGMASVLRRVAQDRAAVWIVRTAAPRLHGTPRWVGADFVELVEHPVGQPPRGAAARRVTTVPFAALAFVRRASS